MFSLFNPSLLQRESLNDSSNNNNYSEFKVVIII